MCAACSKPFVDLRSATEPLAHELEQACARVIRSGWYLNGPETRAFEQELAEACGTRHAVAVSNGLDALRLTLRSWCQLGCLHPGDEVIVAANTYIASILAITDAGLKPVLVEPDPVTYNLNPRLIEAALSPHTRAIMEVHLYGLSCDHRAIAEIASQHNLLIIEDNAQAIGASQLGVSTGAMGDAAAFSFYPTKNVGALGDAGAVTTDSEEVAAAVRALANYGSDRRYHNIYRGFNCRIDEMQAAMLRVKLRHLEKESRRRSQIADIYNRLITHPLVTKPATPEGSRHVWHQYVIRSPRRDELRKYLEEHDVPTDIHYATPPHLQPCYEGVFTSPLPLTEQLANEVVSLPIASVSEAEAKQISQIINSFN